MISDVMNMKNPAEKGHAFERKIAKDLSLWLSNNQEKSLLWRTPTSGAMAHKLPTAQARLVGGDIGVLDSTSEIAVTFVSHFFCELKHYKVLDWSSFIIHDKGFIKTTWQKAHKEAAEHNRVPLVIMKQNFYPEVVLLSSLFMQYLKAHRKNYLPEASIIRDTVSVCSWLNFLSTDPSDLLFAAAWYTSHEQSSQTSSTTSSKT